METPAVGFFHLWLCSLGREASEVSEAQGDRAPGAPGALAVCILPGMSLCMLKVAPSASEQSQPCRARAL